MNQPSERSKKPKALYLGFDVGFMNPTRECLLEALAQAVDLTCFGPGYCSPVELAVGVEDFIERKGPFDFIIVDEFSLQDFGRMRKQNRLRFINHACRFDRSLLALGEEFYNYVKQYKGRRLIALMQSDYYNFTERHVDRLREVGDFFLSWGGELILPKRDFDPGKMPDDGVNAAIYGRWTDQYADFVNTEAVRIISCPQFVANDEGSDRRLAARPYEWCCLGSDYNARVVARRKLDGTGLKRPGRWMPQAFAIADKLHFNVYGKYWTIHALRWGFRRALRQAKYAFTCGSILSWPIRKFFEIPVNGAVLVCEPPQGFKDLGFCDQKNAIAVLAEDVLDAHAWLSADIDRAQRIADAGRELVLQKHSIGARAQQIGLALNSILAGTFRGSQWRNGEFQLLEASDEDGKQRYGQQ